MTKISAIPCHSGQTTVCTGFILQVTAGEVTTGFLHAVKACGDVLAEHFPATDKNRNELPDHLIEI